MGINQWSKVYIYANSPACGAYNIKPGEYIVMYDLSSRELIFKEPIQGRVVVRKQLNLPFELACLVPDQASLKAMENLIRGKTSGGGPVRDHHIIPVHLWKKSQLVIAAQKYNVPIDMNGKENRMLLPTKFHEKNHGLNSKYSKTVRYYLEDRWNALVEVGEDNNPKKIEEQLLSLIDALRQNLQELVLEDGYINDL